ncbi:MAG: chromosomal replication initiator protein DnaA [Kiritimatiellaeota bacterium]|nr:chromosomal replication initiator protein DnaA [Kiritimatiellota bacterium]
MDVQPLWENACKHLKEILNPDVYSRWIAVIRPLEIANDTLVLSVENDFCKMWLEDNYLQLIVNALRLGEAPESLHVKFTVRQQEPATEPEEVAEPGQAAPGEKEKRRPQRRMKGVAVTELNERLTFEEFVVGPSNSFVHAAAIGVTQSLGKAYNPLFIHGQSGLGKTHLLQAIGHRVAQTMAGARVAYVTTESLLNEYVDAIRSNTTLAFRNRYRSVDLLLVDDVHFFGGKESLQEEFFHTFNTLFNARKQIVMTSDRLAREIPGLEERLVTRFQWGLVIALEKPNFETRLAILRYKHQSANRQLSEDVLMFIADNIQSNVRALECGLNTALWYANQQPEVPMNVERVRDILKDVLDKEQLKDLTFDEIQRAVAEFYDVRLTDMSSKQRPQSVALPRQIAMYLARKLTHASLQDIANAFGKTHATVLYAAKAIQNRIDTEEKLRGDVRQITRRLGRDPVAYQL